MIDYIVMTITCIVFLVVVYLIIMDPDLRDEDDNEYFD